MRICLITSRQERCGIAVYSRQIASALMQQGVEVQIEKICSLTDWKALASWAHQCDIVHIQHEFSFFGRGFFSSSSNFRSFISRVRIPVVTTIHELAVPRPGGLFFGARKALLYCEQRRMFRACALCIVHSRQTAELLSSMGVEQEKVMFMSHPVSTVIPADTIPSSGFKKVAVLGFVVARKGYEIVLSLAARDINCEFIIAGGPHAADRTGYFKKLTKRVAEEGLGGKIRITGFIADDALSAFMSGIDIVLAPFSSVFASGSVNLAAAYGKPVLASDIPYFRELKENRFGVELFRNGDAADAFEKLNVLSRNTQRLRELACLNAEYSARNSYACVATRHLLCYERLLSGKGK